MSKKVAIIGAGPAGLTAAYLLGKAAQDVTVFEKDPTYVGGISRTESYKGYHFDIGGHRFFSKSKEVEDFWTEILSDELLERPRSSRIFYNKKFFSYPLAAFEALLKLGIFESFLCVMSYLKAKLFPIKDPQNFEDWVTNQFGKRLFNIFFKTYTEKVWGIPCKEISADWAAQRIKGLSLSSAVWNALFKPSGKKRKKHAANPVKKTSPKFIPMEIDPVKQAAALKAADIKEQERVDFLQRLSKTQNDNMGKKENLQYTGERKLVGIATMHKSNAVPIFEDDKEHAIDIARMRR